MTTTQPTSQPTFGNLRKPRRAGLNSLSFGATALLFGGLLGFILLSITPGLGLAPAGLWLLAALVLVALLQIRDADELTVLHKVHRRTAARRARRAGSNLYRAGLLGVVPGRTAQLPGLAAGSTLAEGWDSYGRRFALLHHPSTGDYVAVFAVEPDGYALVDPWEINSRVAHWGAFLASLGDEPGLQSCAVTVETAPDTGSRLRRSVEQAIDPDSPPIARAMLSEVVARYPTGSAVIRGYVTLTFAAAVRSGGKKRSTEEVVRDLAARLPKLSDRLQFTGAGAVRPVTAEELCEVVRVAYDPAAAAVIEEARAHGDPLELRWDEIGPTTHQAEWDYYFHDGAVSVTWGMTAPPRGVFHSNVLADLLAPHTDIARKRVTLLYETLPAAKAADAVQRDVNDADFRVSSAVRPSARVRTEAAAASKAADEEAAGAGVVNVGMLVTATVVDPGLAPGERVGKRNRTREERLAAALDDAIAAVDSLAAGSRIRLRKQYNAQDSGFAAALPLGLNLERHLALPAAVREAL